MDAWPDGVWSNGVWPDGAPSDGGPDSGGNTAIGVESIDALHRALAGRIARYRAAVAAGGADGDLRDLLAGVVTLADEHFVQEERLMRDAGYPRVDDHIGNHAHSARMIHDLVQRHGGAADLHRRIVQGLGHWLIAHIDHDRDFARWHAARTRESPPATPDPAGCPESGDRRVPPRGPEPCPE